MKPIKAKCLSFNELKKNIKDKTQEFPIEDDDQYEDEMTLLEEIDGVQFWGYKKKENIKKDFIDKEYQK